jgi:leucyl/phenylalanyl-tRNA--protein transferase
MSTHPARQTLLVSKALTLYRQGWFPMFDDARRVVEWVQPHERGLLPLDGRFRVPRSLRQRVRSGRFSITCDRAFGAVIRACATPAAGREHTWLCPEIITLFESLHAAGHAHSIEAWMEKPPPQWHRGAEREEGTGETATGSTTTSFPSSSSASLRLCGEGCSHFTLVGGLYGLAIGGVFCGESMFSRPDLGGTDASKVCLVHLVEHLRAQGFTVLDAQLHNDHLEQFGLYEVAMREYLEVMRAAAGRSVVWGEFDPLRAERTHAG